MLHGVEADVVHMRGVITVVPDHVFPEPPLPIRLADRCSPGGRLLEKPALMACHRDEKSASPFGNVQMQCICSGRTTQASMWAARARACPSTRRWVGVGFGQQRFQLAKGEIKTLAET